MQYRGLPIPTSMQQHGIAGAVLIRPNDACSFQEDTPPVNRDAVEGKTRNFATRMLAQHLMFSLQIRQGKELVMILGTTGLEADNLEAVTSWVNSRIGPINEWPIPDAQAAHLIERLEQELKDIVRDISCGWA